MFCPSCRDEFRPGFTRCEGCGVDLVDDPDQVVETPQAAKAIPVGPVPMADYCGFVSLDEARQSRDALREGGMRWEIAIRPAQADLSGSDEEYWLRVEASRLREAMTLLGFEQAEAAADDGMACGKCGAAVADDAPSCPSCGERFS